MSTAELYHAAHPSADWPAQIKQLRDENEELKAEIKKLEAEILKLDGYFDEYPDDLPWSTPVWVRPPVPGYCKLCRDYEFEKYGEILGNTPNFNAYIESSQFGTEMVLHSRACRDAGCQHPSYY